MFSTLTFLKKEFKEITRTYKIWVVPLIFLFFGFLSPVVVKVLPDILKPQLEAQKIFIDIPTPRAVDSFLQYFKNLAQIGMLAVILVSMGLVSEEKAKGTLALVLTKPVSRAQVIISKFLAQTFLVLGSIILGGVACYLYNIILFEKTNFSKFTQGTFLYLVYAVLVIVITLFFSTLFSNQIAAGGLSLVTLFVLSLLPSITESFAKYSPGALTSFANKIVSGDSAFSEAIWPASSAITLLIILLSLSVLSFNRQEL